jgi:recombination protein RecA
MGSRASHLHEFVSFLSEENQAVHRIETWGLNQIAGRFVELSGEGSSAKLTMAFGLVLEAQQQQEITSWITLSESTFFPPDVAESGIDLETLAVIRVTDLVAAARSAIQLLRSGSFGLIVIDLAPGWKDGPAPSIPAPLQTKLIGLAQKHGTAVVVLTEKSPDAPSLGSLVSLRADVNRVELSARVLHPFPANFEVQLKIVKDKRLGPGRVHREVCHGPAGLY